MQFKFFFAFLVPLACLTSWVRAQEFSINLQSNGEEIAVIDLSIKDGLAITSVVGVTERFDLKENRWQDDKSKQWVSYIQCEAWATQSKEKTKNSKTPVPEQIRPFILWSLEPSFTISATGETLNMTSGQVDYKIVGQKSDGDPSNYFRYARLNAYKKAMTERKLPPFAELMVLDELERRKMLPKTMEIVIPGVPQSPKIRIVVSQKN